MKRFNNHWRTAVFSLFLQYLRRYIDIAQRVIQLVSNTRCQGPDCREFFALQELFILSLEFFFTLSELSFHSVEFLYQYADLIIAPPGNRLKINRRKLTFAGPFHTA